MRYPKLMVGMLAMAGMLCTQPARADVVDPLIEGAKLCTNHLPRYEREYAIPTHLLSAIASTESGRYHEGLKIRIPWPWTINANGKGYFFASKEEAMSAVRKFQARGVQSIDVGCMQVNLYHHARAFSSLEEAFDPAANIAYAAGFLRNLYQEGGSWKQAAADYHSKTPRLGNEYVGQVYNSWFQIVDKLRIARLQVPENSVVAMNDMKSDAPSAAPTRAMPVKFTQAQAPAFKSAGLPEQHGKKLAGFKARHMNSIQISHGTPRDNGVMIVRPEITVANDSRDITRETLQMASTMPLPRQAATEGNAQIIRVDNRRVIETPTDTRSGPRFIFND